MQLLGNRVRHGGSTTAVFCRSDSLAPSADYDVSANLYIVNAGGAPSVGICGRMAGPGAAPLTFYQARIVNGTGIVLLRFLNGTAVSLATYAYTSVAGAEPKLTLRMRGDQISLLLDDVLVIGPITDANIPGPGYVGMRMASASSSQIHIDNLTASTLDADGATAASAALLWEEAGDAASISGAVIDRASIAWSEAGDTASVEAVAKNRGTLQWTEQGDNSQLSGAVSEVVVSSISAALSWTEAGDVPDISMRATNRGALSYSEQGDVWSLGADAGRIPPLELSARFHVLPRNFTLKTIHFSN